METGLGSEPLAVEEPVARERVPGSLGSSSCASGDGESAETSLSLSFPPFLVFLEVCCPIWTLCEPGCGDWGLDLVRREVNTESRVGASLTKCGGQLSLG